MPSNAALFGNTVSDPTSKAGQVDLLYQAALGRAPDPFGFENTVNALNSGATLDTITNGLLSSPEYTADYGPVGERLSALFITTLYQNALGRLPDAGGLLGYETALLNGTSRAQVAESIALSAESIGRAQPMFQAGGVFAPDEADSSVARLYYGVLGRTPDAGGLQNLESRLQQGSTLTDVANGMLSSAEYTATAANQTNTQFVQALYNGALGRSPDAGGAQTYTNALDAGATRASIALAISESPEARAHLAQYIEVGHQVL